MAAYGGMLIVDDARCLVYKTFPLILVLFCLLSGCNASTEGETRTFLLRTDVLDVVQLTRQLTEVISFNLEASQSLRDGYPLPGHIEFEADPSSPGMQKMRCTPVQPARSDTIDCLLLNELKDFVRAQPVTWESAAFYMYRVYVAPESLLASVDPAKDFVALDVFILGEHNLWETVDQAIRESAVEVGARPFRP